MDYEDIDELEADVYSKDYKTPKQVQDYLYNEVYKRDWKLYLNSIEWDGMWLKHDTPEERRIKEEERLERKRQMEMENSPFAKWF
jgi:hypothetical protein